MMYLAIGKRVLDLVVVLASAVVWLPVAALVAILVRWQMGSPVLYSQQRPGLHGQLFTMHKFRTMTDGRDASGDLLDDAQRLTRLGRWLRRTSLDEVPELWNVLKGDMSLVGPRPLPRQYLDRYSAEQATRHDAMPGVTGLAQVEGRNSISWDEKFRLDLEYVSRRSLSMDLGILAKTMGVVIGGRGVSSDDHATMPEFMGSEGDGVG